MKGFVSVSKNENAKTSRRQVTQISRLLSSLRPVSHSTPACMHWPGLKYILVLGGSEGCLMSAYLDCLSQRDMTLWRSRSSPLEHEYMESSTKPLQEESLFLSFQIIIAKFSFIYNFMLSSCLLNVKHTSSQLLTHIPQFSGL